MPKRRDRERQLVSEACPENKAAVRNEGPREVRGLFLYRGAAEEGSFGLDCPVVPLVRRKLLVWDCRFGILQCGGTRLCFFGQPLKEEKEIRAGINNRLVMRLVNAVVHRAHVPRTVSL